MLKVLLARVQQGHRTSAFPDQPPALPDRFRGLPVLDSSRCVDGCRACVEACPTGAISATEERALPASPVAEPRRAEHPEAGLRLDLGRCLFCPECVQACPEGAIAFTTDHRLAARTRDGLVLRGPEEYPYAAALDAGLRRLFGRSLKLRVVSAGGCNGCESDVNVLGTPVFDLGRFGIQYVASPRHADGLLITGPVTENMRLALKKTYDAIPPPKIVIAVGACAISGGPYIDHAEQHNGADAVVPVDLYVPGCPPHPFTILDGLLRLLGRIDERAAQARAEVLRRYRGEIRDESIEWGTTRAEEGVKYLGLGAQPTDSDRRKP